jgi:hypothetical protein
MYLLGMMTMLAGAVLFLFSPPDVRNGRSDLLRRRFPRQHRVSAEDEDEAQDSRDAEPRQVIVQGMLRPGVGP